LTPSSLASSYPSSTRVSGSGEEKELGKRDSALALLVLITTGEYRPLNF
jgi:hypothetical protein